jgi:multidrug efflux pump subunit AcrA (membrane-fusion protein)
VLDAYPTVRHRGRVTEISPRVNRVKATVVVRVAFVDSAEGVLPDMAARVSFLEGELDAEAVKEPPKVVVPSSAVVTRGSDKFVFVLDENGTARQERVTLGAAMGPGFELVDGPPEGTKIIANPPAAIADGYPVKEKIE